MGRAYYLQIHRKDKSKFNYLGYAFWIRTDGSNHIRTSKSVDGKLRSPYQIPDRAEQILEQIGYLD